MRKSGMVAEAVRWFQLIKNGGFTIEQTDKAYLAPFPKCGSYCFWGIATPQVP
jgi:hypothetical protein